MALINCNIAFYIYKDIWKQSISIVIIAVNINVITNYIFIVISILYISISELTELHELTLHNLHTCIFPFPFDCKISYRKTKIIAIDLSTRTRTTHNCSKLYKLLLFFFILSFYVVWIFLLPFYHVLDFFSNWGMYTYFFTCFQVLGQNGCLKWICVICHKC